MEDNDFNYLLVIYKYYSLVLETCQEPISNEMFSKNINSTYNNITISKKNVFKSNNIIKFI